MKMMVRGLYLVLILCLSFGLGCDSSSSDGGGGVQPATAGYSQADLTGEWLMAGLFGERRAITFDSQGRLLRMKASGFGKRTGYIGQIVVNSDGSLKGKVCNGGGGGYHCYSFSDMSFRSKDQVSGKMGYFQYIDGFGKTDFFWYGPVRLGRYIP